MKKLLIATNNQGKLDELRIFLEDLPLQLVFLSDVEIGKDFEEIGKTFEENSRLKALYYAKKSGLPTVADDGGLEIDELNGEPGTKSRRWLGYEASDEELIHHMKKIIKTLPAHNRKAFLTVVLSFALPNGKVWSRSGRVQGVLKELFGQKVKGYPYRNFFYLPQINKYYQDDQLSDTEQKKYNHRYKAIHKLIPIMRRELDLK